MSSSPRRKASGLSIAAPQAAATWEEPSALAEMTVGGLTAHLVYALASINAHPNKPVPETEPIDTVTYYVSVGYRRDLGLGA